MSKVKQVYLKDEQGNVVSPVVSKDSIYNNYLNIRSDGTEFETGRIIDGKIEYGKILYLDSLPATGSVDVQTGIKNFERYTFIDGYTSNAYCAHMVPEQVNTSSIRIVPMYSNGNVLRVVTYTNSYAEAGYKAWIEIHYTKLN